MTQEEREEIVAEAMFHEFYNNLRGLQIAAVFEQDQEAQRDVWRMMARAAIRAMPVNSD